MMTIKNFFIGFISGILTTLIILTITYNIYFEKPLKQIIKERCTCFICSYHDKTL